MKCVQSNSPARPELQTQKPLFHPFHNSMQTLITACPDFWQLDQNAQRLMPVRQAASLLRYRLGEGFVRLLEYCSNSDDVNNNNNSELIERFRKLKVLYNLKKNMQMRNYPQLYKSVVYKHTKNTKINKLCCHDF